MPQPDQTTAPGVQDSTRYRALAGEWVLVPSRSTVSLKNRSMWGLGPVKGVFRQVTGEGTVSPAGEASGIITVAAASIDTRNARRDNHLRSADFFDAGNYPHITFIVERITPAGQDVTIAGTLTVRDCARPLAFDGTAAVRGDGEIWLDAQVHVNHVDFGLTWNWLGSVSPNNTLTIHAVFTRR
jgi:polyisoprenoid-binding protein YceI